jgi:nitrate reductase gamma subunit
MLSINQPFMTLGNKFKKLKTGDLMDSVMMIRVISGVLFVVGLFILIQRRKARVSGN